MIFTYLVIFVVALVIANILVVLAKPKKKFFAFEAQPAQEINSTENTYTEHPEVITALQDMDQRHSLVQGSLNATHQKLNILNNRLTEVEKAVTGIIETRMALPETTAKQEDVDYEKINFKISVLEDEIDKLKSPKHAPKTFYGKIDPDTEKEIKSLVFNSKKKVTS